MPIPEPNDAVAAEAAHEWAVLSHLSGRKGGLKGGQIRASKLSPQQRSTRHSNARPRWLPGSPIIAGP
jgi:hypothetical protein